MSSCPISKVSYRISDFSRDNEDLSWATYVQNIIKDMESLFIIYKHIQIVLVVGAIVFVVVVVIVSLF